MGSSDSTSKFAQISGSVGIRFTWTGSNRPAVAWLAVSSSASWQSDHGSGTVADGYGDLLKNAADGKSGVSSGIRVYRVTSPTFTKTVDGLDAYANVTSSTGMLTNCGVNCGVMGFVANKNASLARTDGGGFNAQSKDDVYQADTLLSWDNSDGVDPGPTSQSLTGTYGGTWTKFNGGSDDNVNVGSGSV